MDRLFYYLVLAQEGLGGAPAGPAGAPAGNGGGAAAAEGAPAASPGGGYEQIIFLVLLLVVFYFLLIRPQQKRAKKHKQLVGGLKRGDRVITSSGIFGKITALDERSVTLEVDKNTRIQVLKSYVGGLANAETEKQLAENPPA